jgi:hypothetical protein
VVLFAGFLVFDVDVGVVFLAADALEDDDFLAAVF